MKVAAYSSTSSFQVLEGLAEPSLELSVMHVGIEECKPFHTCCAYHCHQALGQEHVPRDREGYHRL